MTDIQQFSKRINRRDFGIVIVLECFLQDLQLETRDTSNQGYEIQLSVVYLLHCVLNSGSFHIRQSWLTLDSRLLRHGTIVFYTQDPTNVDVK